MARYLLVELNSFVAFVDVYRSKAPFGTEPAPAYGRCLANNELAAGNELAALENGANLRYYNKTYWKLPFNWGEVQYGHISHSLVVWFKGRRYIVWKGKVD